MQSRFSLTFAAVLFISLASVIAADSPTTAPTTAPTTSPATITWDQAKDHIGQTVTVTGPLMGSHSFGSAVVLNIGKDYPDASRFTVYVHTDKLPDEITDGKTIATTGVLKLFHEVPEIEAKPGNVTVIASPSTQP